MPTLILCGWAVGGLVGGICLTVLCFTKARRRQPFNPRGGYLVCGWILFLSGLVIFVRAPFVRKPDNVEQGAMGDTFVFLALTAFWIAMFVYAWSLFRLPPPSEMD